MKSYKTHLTTNPYLKRVRKHKIPYKTRILGKEIIVYPNVMSPKYDWSSRFHIQKMPNQKGKDFLEIGCGSGIISLFAGFQGANKITAVDINKNALLNTKNNLDNHKIKNFDVFYSDVFKSVNDKYDTITFAAPYHGNKPNNILEYGVSDPSYRALKIFMNNAKNYLKTNGQIILGFSNTGDIDLLNKLIIENRFFVKNFYEEENNGWKAYLYILEPIKFKSKKQGYIYDDDLKWFYKYKSKITSGKVLKIGFGLGYVSHFIWLYNKNIISLDICSNKDSIFKKNLRIYDGLNIPFLDKSFDTVVTTYMLHHITLRDKIIKEIIRVSRNNIVILEETYTSLLSKLSLIYNDIKTNFMAKQKVEIHPSKYFKEGEIDNLMKYLKLKIEEKYSSPKRLYKKELFIINKGKRILHT
ncbi:MAG: methyltransferase [Nanoarchaeota archaeon]